MNSFEISVSALQVTLCGSYRLLCLSMPEAQKWGHQLYREQLYLWKCSALRTTLKVCISALFINYTARKSVSFFIGILFFIALHLPARSRCCCFYHMPLQQVASSYNIIDVNLQLNGPHKADFYFSCRYCQFNLTRMKCKKEKTHTANLASLIFFRELMC